MSDEWNEDFEPAPKKKRGGVPAWLMWGCGIGCLLLILGAIGLGVGGYFLTKKAADPEYVLPRLQERLQCDEWPAEYSGVGFLMAGTGDFEVYWPGGTAQLNAFGGRDELEVYMDPDSPVAGLVEQDVVMGTAMIQGREVRARTFQARFEDTYSTRVDLSGNRPPYFCVVLPSPGRGEIDEALFERFLAPFDVWRGEE